jgi:hypothetical protein
MHSSAGLGRKVVARPRGGLRLFWVLGSAGSLRHTTNRRGGRSPCTTESRRSKGGSRRQLRRLAGHRAIHELTGFLLTGDCLAPGCKGERSFAVAELASFYGQDCTVGQVPPPHAVLRCSGGRVGPPGLSPGPLRGPEAEYRRGGSCQYRPIMTTGLVLDTLDTPCMLNVDRPN